MAQFLGWLGAHSTSPHSTEIDIFERYIVGLASPPRPTTARIFVASWAHAALLGFASVSPSTRHWTAVRAIHSHIPLGVSDNRAWFQPAWFNVPFAISNTRDALDYAACLFSWVFLLRVSEARTLTADDLHATQIRITPSKSSLTNAWRTVPVSLRPWVDFLLSQQSPGALFNIRSATLFARRLVPDNLPFTWHAFRRGGATTLAALGAPVPNILLWGRWHSHSVLSRYIEHGVPFDAAPTTVVIAVPSPFRLVALPLQALWPPHLFGPTAPEHHRLPNLAGALSHGYTAASGSNLGSSHSGSTMPCATPASKHSAQPAKRPHDARATSPSVCARASRGHYDDDAAAISTTDSAITAKRPRHMRSRRATPLPLAVLRTPDGAATSSTDLASAADIDM